MKLSTPMPGTGATELAWDVNVGRRGGWGNHVGWAQEQISVLLKPSPKAKQTVPLRVAFFIVVC